MYTVTMLAVHICENGSHTIWDILVSAWDWDISVNIVIMINLLNWLASKGIGDGVTSEARASPLFVSSS